MRADRAEAADIIDLDFHKELFFFFYSIQCCIKDFGVISLALIVKFSIVYKKE